MYTALLVLHSWFRWFALATVLITFLRAVRGLIGGLTWTDGDARVAKGAAHVVTTQAVLGLLLYFSSPLIKQLLADMSTTMADRPSRFMAVEHGVMMILALGLVHMGSALSRKGADDRAKHKRAAIFFGVALLLMGYAIPWVRPMLRMGAP